MARKLTTEEFITKAQAAHQCRYNYSRVSYYKSTVPVIITCNKHGEFEQKPALHLQGSGCPSCGREETRKGQQKNNELSRKTTNHFIDEARIVHGDVYLYDSVNYSACDSKVDIRCALHGLFSQTPSKHLLGTGCPKCANKQVTTEEFVRKCQEVHGDRYDYSEVIYKPGYTKVKIGCKEHGIFEQVTYNHLSNKQGCPVCGAESAKNNIGSYNMTNFERYPETKDIPATLYTIRCYDGDEEFVKVGITTMANPKRRYNTIPYSVEVIEEIECTLYEAYLAEQRIKQDGNRYHPVKKFSGWTECLTTSYSLREHL